ncbi:hypothetical protein BKA70DRAFT_1153062 [Coprinopsis sp. MPI-PUGE-AT-0042]|nr:hypothetical protein BKA70DRAFT_1153062 [Coprinopsis sp. MPI-PUGE-AT-0042]
MVGLSRTFVVGLLSLAIGIQSHRLIARQDEDSSLFFDTIPPLTICEPRIIQWDYFGRQSPMTLIVFNIGVEPSPSTVFPGPVNKTLSTSITPFSGAYEWAVDVPPGTYRFNASIPAANVLVQSGVFEVSAGPDSSCLPSSSASSPAPSSTPDPSSQTSPVPQTSSDSISPSDTSLPTAPQPSTRSHTGTIVGAVLGVVGLGIVVLAAFFLIRRMTPIKSKNGHGKPGGRWNGLGSTDSRTVLSNVALAKGGGGAPRDRQSSSGQQRKRHYAGDSMASMQMTDESFGAGVGGGEKYTSSRKNSAATTHEDHEGMVLSTLPSLPRQPSNRDFTANGRRPSYPDTQSDERPRRNSRSQQSTPYPEANISRSSSAANTPYQASAPVPSTPGDKANRNSIGAGNGRKRKPVPAYNPSELAASPNTSPFSSPPTLVTPSPAVASSALDHEGTSLQTPGHYTTRNVNSRPDAGDSNEALAHKSSFGPTGVVEGKQMHYLMPDLPPDVRSSKRR